MSDLFAKLLTEQQTVTQNESQPVSPPPTQEKTRSIEQPLDQSTSQPISQSINQSTTLSINHASQIVDRPKAFYISRRLDRRLDEAVRYLQDKHGIKKVDRSIIVNILLDREELWSELALDQLVKATIELLTSRLTSQ